MIVEAVDNGWRLSSSASLTDEEAKAITFRAAPEQVTLGSFVELADPEGIRIGHLSSASYREPLYGPGYVVVSIELR
jgi:hypothetical protein